MDPILARMDVGLQLTAVRAWLTHLCSQAGPPSIEVCRTLLAERSIRRANCRLLPAGWILTLIPQGHRVQAFGWGPPGSTPGWVGRARQLPARAVATLMVRTARFEPISRTHTCVILPSLVHILILRASCARAGHLRRISRRHCCHGYGHRRGGGVTDGGTFHRDVRFLHAMHHPVTYLTTSTHEPSRTC